jgi:hypothetical protein
MGASFFSFFFFFLFPSFHGTSPGIGFKDQQKQNKNKEPAICLPLALKLLDLVADRGAHLFEQLAPHGALNVATEGIAGLPRGGLPDRGLRTLKLGLALGTSSLDGARNLGPQRRLEPV